MQANGDLRLAGTPLDRPISEGYGRLEILLDGKWGTICGPIKNQTIADTACRQLGYAYQIQFG